MRMPSPLPAAVKVLHGAMPTAITRIALVVPPSPRPTLRAYYCTSTSKGRYYWPQIDLWVQAAYLQQVAEVRLFDGVLHNAATLRKDLKSFAPELAICMVGGFSHAGDLVFARQLTQDTGCLWIATGEAVLFPRSFWHGVPGLLGLLTNFAGDGVLRLVRDGVAGEGLVPLAPGIATSHEQPDVLRWGPPPAWPLKGYRFPMLGTPLAVVLTTFGCPFACTYCNNNRHVFGSRFRDLDDLFIEFDTWAERGVRNLYIRDVNFGGPAKRAKEILARMATARHGFRWSTFLRPELVDEEMADLLLQAGCVQVQMGVESANTEVLRAVARGGTAELVQRAFALLDHRGIRRGGHFVLGLPGESEADIEATIAWAERLDPDYAAFNMAVVRAGTKYYSPGAETGDCTIARGDLLGSIDRARLAALRRQAIRRIYTHPRFLRRSLKTAARDPRLLAGMLSDGLTLLGRATSEAIAGVRP